MTRSITRSLSVSFVSYNLLLLLFWLKNCLNWPSSLYLYRARCIGFLAERYRDNVSIAGYDVSVLAAMATETKLIRRKFYLD